ncbi:hypothetical protein [uncultured Mediterranean phage]|nr:hypothetical protein [uncultured Mediterranean phage]
MTTVQGLAEDLHDILSSFSRMLEGVYHVDDELAAVIADKFADRLRNDVRAIYAEMTGEISEGLKKPAKKKRTRRTKQEIVMSETDGMMVMEDEPDRAIGAEELPVNETTLLHAENDGDADLLAERMLNNTRVTDRSAGAGGNTSSWDTNNPTMRRIGS